METQKKAKEALLAVGQKEWLTPREVSSEYLFSTSTLAKWRMRDLNLVYHKIGKFIRYKRSDIEAFLESNKVEVA